MSLVIVQGLYWYIGWMAIADPKYKLSKGGAERIGWSIGLYAIGISLMLTSDAQKTFTRQVRPGLITTGLFAYTRNPNYLGEILLYLSFACMSKTPDAFYIVGCV
jgi:steroid 5-alpha reductase family enzyme